MKVEVSKVRELIKNIGMGKLALMVVCGIVLVLASVDSPKNKENENPSEASVEYSHSTDEYEKEMEERLKELLESMEGVGAVQVMVTVKATTQKVVLTEKPYSSSALEESDGEGGERYNKEESVDCNTVYVTDENGNTVPYVLNEIMPKIEGVAVIAEGGDLPEVKNKINTVVKSLFDIEANKISISKMK